MTQPPLAPLPSPLERAATPVKPRRPAFRESTASALLDLIRGLAAVLVLLDHTHHLFFTEIPATASHPHLLALLYGLTNSGPEAVVVFFVLSGYLVSGSVLRWIARDEWSWKRYLVHRLVRLWIVLLPALLLCAVWDIPRVFLYSPKPHGFFAQAALEHLTWRALLGSVFFVQTILTPTFGSDRVLWSLAFEFWYYIFFPLAALALNRRTPSQHRVLYAIAFLPIAAFAGRSVLALFPVWLLGVALHRLKPPPLASFVRWLAALFYFGLFTYISLHPWTSHVFKPDYVLGLATAVLIWTLLATTSAHQQSAFVRTSRWLASFSYSLYLVHYPLLAFLSAALLRGNQHWSPDARHLLLGLAMATLAFLYAFVVGRLTEFHNDAVRDRVERRLGVHSHQNLGRPSSAT